MAVPLDIHMGLEGIFTYMWKSEKKTHKNTDFDEVRKT